MVSSNLILMSLLHQYEKEKYIIIIVMDSSNTKDISNIDGTTYRIYLDQELGKGMFGTVYKVKCLTTGRAQGDYAIKTIDKKNLLVKEKTEEGKARLWNRLKQEVETWKKSSHPNIVKFHDFIETPNSCYFISEYCDGPTLEKYIKEKGRTEDSAAQEWFRGLASAVSYLHSINIIHRDIKPSNIIFKGNVPKLVDFGFAKQYIPDSVQTVGVGTPKYMSPELLEYRDNYTNKVDIWALGWTFFEVLYKQDPFPIDSVRAHDDLLNVIIENEIKFPKNIPISNKTKDLLISMLQVEEDDRIDHEELVKRLK